MKKKSIIIIILLLCIISIFALIKVIKYNENGVDLNKVFDIQNIEESEFETYRSKSEGIATIYNSLLTNNEGKELIVLKQKVSLDGTTGKMLYARDNTYKNQLNVYQVKYNVKDFHEVNEKIEQFIKMSRKFLNIADDTKSKNNLYNVQEREDNTSAGEYIYSYGAICSNVFEYQDDNKGQNNESENTQTDDKYNINFYMERESLICELVMKLTDN